MPRGGHARSGPPIDPNSGRSERRGIKFTALPAFGYDGPVPEWPLPLRECFMLVDKLPIPDVRRTEQVADREAALWAWAWSTPQAWAWSQPSESWRLHTIAMWVRTYVLCESSEATAADKGSLHRFADQIGMSPAGLKENCWVIAKDELGEKRAESSENANPEPASGSARSRVKVIAGGA